MLERVWQGQAYASLALDAELKRTPQLDARDVALATQLVYGVLRCEGALIKLIEQHASNNRWRKTPALKAQLLMAAYSLYGLDRIPPYAAVNAAVQAVRRGQGQRVAGFCNAVLRKLAKGVPEEPQRWLREQSVRALPRWLRAGLKQVAGEGLPALLGSTETPPLALCLRADEPRERWLKQLRQAAPEAGIEPGALSPRAVLLRGAGDLRALPGADVAWRVQEEGAQLVGLALGARPKAKALDACAGNGGKTLLLRELVGAEGIVHAADKHPRKLDRLRAAAGAAVDATFAVDWSRGGGDAARDYDVALVDAPCSGLGTLRRRPELLGRLSRKDITQLAALQLAITRRVAGCLRPGGTLLYAVCSLLPDEAEQVLAQLGEPHEGRKLVPHPFETPWAASLASGGHTFRLLPHTHGTDGYFVAQLRVETA